MSTQAQLRETAIDTIVRSSKADRAGDLGDPVHRQVPAAIEAACAAGCNGSEIQREADRRYAAWLINNAGR